MTNDMTALQLVLTGDPGLFAIVWLSLLVSLSAVLCAALVGVPFGALLALVRFPGREALIVILNALMGLPPVVAEWLSIVAHGERSARNLPWISRPCGVAYISTIFK